jgi:trk system potassium uptake protein TrkA
MKICIIGAGVVGSNIAKTLSSEGYHVVVVDKDREKVEELQNFLDVSAFVCDALDDRCLDNFSDFDFFIIATDKDEVNISISVFVKSIFSSKKKVLIRINRNLFYIKEIQKFLNIDIVNTFEEVYNNIKWIIEYPFLSSINELEDGKFILIGFKVSEDNFLKNKKLSDLKPLRDKIPFTIALIERNGKDIFPSGDRVILEGDYLYLLLEKENLDSFISMLQIKNPQVKSIVFLGISDFLFEILRKLLTEKNLKIKVIEKSMEKCERIAEEFPEVLVIHGKTTDEELLEREGISEADIVLSMTYSEEGILACILSKTLGAKKIVALVDKPEYEEISNLLGIDMTIVPRKLVARKVYQKIGHKGFIDIFELKKDVHVFEKKVGKDLDGKHISDKFKKNILVLAVKRDNSLYIASGKTVLKEGDYLILMEARENE